MTRRTQTTNAAGFAIACLLLCVLVSGCATVRSAPRAKNELASGLTYYLPKRDMKLTAERKLLRKDEVEKALAAKKSELEAASTALKASKASVVTLKARAASSAVLASAEASAAVAKELAIAEGDVETGTTKTAAIDLEIKTLEASLLAINAGTSAACTFQYSAKIEALAPTPDTRLRLTAVPFHSALRDDDTKLSVTPEGLLTTANIVAADRTGDIIVEIAGAIAGLGGGVPIDIAAMEGPPAVPPRCDQIPTKFVYRFDPVQPGEPQGVNDALAQAEFPFRVGVPTMNGAYKYTDSAADQIIDRQRLVNSSNDLYVLEEALDHRGREGALFYRTALPQTVELRQCQTASTCPHSVDPSVPIDAAVVFLPQAGPLSYIPMRSSAFVKTVDDVTFDNGMVTSWTASRPSEVLEVVRLPVKILKAVVSVPAEIIKLRVDLSDQQKGLAASQEAQIAAQTKLLVIQTCVRAAADDQDKQMACFDVE